MVSKDNETILIVGGLIVGGYLLYKSNVLGSFGSAVTDVGQGVGGGVYSLGQGVDYVGAGLGAGLNQIGAGVGYLGEGIGQAIANLGQVGTGASNLLTGLGSGVNQLGTSVNTLSQGFQNALTNLSSDVGTLGASLQTQIGTLRLGFGANPTSFSPVSTNVTQVPSTGFNNQPQKNSAVTTTATNLFGLTFSPFLSIFHPSAQVSGGTGGGSPPSSFSSINKQINVTTPLTPVLNNLLPSGISNFQNNVGAWMSYYGAKV